MITSMLGLTGRIGRLRYFLFTIGLGFVLSAVMMVTIFNFAGSSDDPRELIIDALPIIVVIIAVYAWGTLVLTTKRLRDIGWAPGFVIPLWIGIVLIDVMLTVLMPEWAVGESGQTLLGMMFNAVMVLALLFWPGNGGIDDTALHATLAPRSSRANSGRSSVPRQDMVMRSREQT